MVPVEDLYPYLSGLATNLSSSLLTAGGRRVRDEALGDDQQRALDAVLGDATAAVLVEVARHDRDDLGLPDRLAVEFGRFYRDTWVAETLVDFAISAEEPPLDGLRGRYTAVGNDPGAMAMDFGEAMRLLIYEVADRLRKEASRAGSPLTNLVQVRELGIIRAGQEDLVRRLRLENGDPEIAVGVAGDRERRNGEYERGPDGALHDVLFAGFYLPSGPEGRFTSGGASRVFEGEFFEIFRRELADHRLNTSGMEIEGVDLPVRALDYRPPAGYAGAHDYRGFTEVTRHLGEKALGVVWGTMREAGGLQTLEILVNPDRFYGGPKAFVAISSVKRLADRDELPRRARTVFAARALAAMWAQSYCILLGDKGMYRETYRVAADSRRLVEMALEDLRTAAGAAHAEAVEEQRRELLPQVIRQEATSLKREGEDMEALERFLDALKIWPYGPLSGRAAFREYYEASYAFGFAQHFESWDQFLAENYESTPSFATRELAGQYAERAFVGLLSPDLVLFVGWIQDALERGVDLEEDAERWFSGLAAAHPDDPFVLAYWAEARRVVAVVKYGAGFAVPVVEPVDRAREKFEQALRTAPELKVFAARIQGLHGVVASGLLNVDPEESRRRFGEWARWQDKAKPFYREHAPWLLEDGANDTPERLGRWVGGLYGEKDGG